MNKNTKHVVASVQAFVEVLEEIQCQRVLVIAESISGEFHSHECGVTDGSMTAAQESRFIAKLDRVEVWIRGARQLAAQREAVRAAHGRSE